MGENFGSTHFKLGRYGQFMVQKEYQLWLKDPNQRRALVEELVLVLPHVRKKLAAQNIPQDFQYLAIYPIWQPDTFHIELLPSHVYWVLNQAKAKAVFVAQDTQRDDRKHLVQATEAGIKSIQRDHILYRNWPAALWAQLASSSVVSPGVKTWAKVDTILLDHPSQYALFKFLAFKKMVEREIQKWDSSESYVIWEYPYSKGQSIADLAQELSVSPDRLAAFNAWRLDPLVEDAVLVPLEASRYQETRAFVDFLHQDPENEVRLAYPVVAPARWAPKKAKGGTYYSINGKLGIQAKLHDSFVDLAYQSGISLKDLLQYNELTPVDTPSVGTIYYLEAKNGKGPTPFHTLKPHETLWDVAHQYGMQLKNLLAFNMLRQAAFAQKGQVLWLQQKRPSRAEVTIQDVELPEVLQNPALVHHEPVLLLPVDTEWPTEEVEQELPPLPLRPAERPLPTQPAVSVEPIFHVVKKGETVFRLSVLYQVTIDQIKSWNQLRDNTIYEGARLVVGQK